MVQANCLELGSTIITAHSSQQRGEEEQQREQQHKEQQHKEQNR